MAVLNIQLPGVVCFWSERGFCWTTQ